jgi:hypothetical protein
MRVTVTLAVEAWESLLAALPHCPCGALADIELNAAKACVGCAASVRHGRCRTLEFVDAADAINEALSPFTPAGKWERCGE